LKDSFASVYALTAHSLGAVQGNRGEAHLFLQITKKEKKKRRGGGGGGKRKKEKQRIYNKNLEERRTQLSRIE